MFGTTITDVFETCQSFCNYVALVMLVEQKLHTSLFRLLLYTSLTYCF